MKRYIDSLSWQEQKELIENNSNLENILRDRADDSARFWVDEYLTGAKREFCSYEYGGNYTFFEFDNDSIYQVKNIIDYCEHLSSSYDFFYNCKEYKNFIRVAKSYYYNYSTLNEKDFDLVYNRYIELLEIVGNFISDEIEHEMSWSWTCAAGDLLDFIDSFIEENNGAYINDNDYKKIYVCVPDVFIPEHDELIA